MDDVLTRWDLRGVINASGTMTTLGASRMLPEVAAEMVEISGHFLRIDDLQARAGAEITATTGAEAGFVTCSSAAALTLCTAAALTGSDLAAIDALPDTAGREARVAVQMGQMIDYGSTVAQGIRLAGAQPVLLGSAARCELYHLRAALHAGLAAVVHVVSHHTVREGELPLDLVIEACAAHAVPVIVDMASEYDMTGPIALGAAAAIWSGHKFLSGPTSGIVAGRRDFIRAVALQNRGIGRGMKIGKEGILGAAAALAAWRKRDHAAAQAREAAIVAGWTEALAGLPGVTLAPCPDWTGNPITRLELRIAPDEAGLFAWELADRLMVDDPAVAVRDNLAEHQRLYLDPCNLTADEAATVARAIRDTFAAARARGDGCAVTWSEVKRRRSHHPPDE